MLHIDDDVSHLDKDGFVDEEKLKHVPMLYVTCHYCGFRDIGGRRPGKHDRGKDRPFMSTILPTSTPVDRITPDKTYFDTIWVRCYPGDESNTFYCREENCWQKERCRKIENEDGPGNLKRDQCWSKKGVDRTLVYALWD
jgi:hypothetical protein